MQHIMEKEHTSQGFQNKFLTMNNQRKSISGDTVRKAWFFAVFAVGSIP
jgi:hypothetical protein